MVAESIFFFGLFKEKLNPKTHKRETISEAGGERCSLEIIK